MSTYRKAVFILLAFGVILLIYLPKGYRYTTISVKGIALKTAIANTPAQQKLGLSERARLPDNEAMLFVFDKPQKLGFWMKNMLFPIDIIWINQDCRIVSIAENVQPCPTEGECPTLVPNSLAQYVLETTANFVSRQQLQVGDKLNVLSTCKP